jgi:hypothetical protein
MDDVSFVSDLKLRAGYGRVGNQDIGDFPSLGLYRANYGTIVGLIFLLHGPTQVQLTI